MFFEYYTDKKIQPLKESEKEKIIKILLFSDKDVDKVLEKFIYLNWNRLVNQYDNFSKPAYVKNQILHVQVESKAIFQEILFLKESINEILKKNTGFILKDIKEIPFYYFKARKSLFHKSDDRTKVENSHSKTKITDENQKLIDDLKKIFKK